MLKILKEAFKVGNATIAYPMAPMETIEHTRGKPEHDAVECIACGACAEACPANAIQMTSDLDEGTITWSINYGRCVFCGRCEEVCPTQAIMLTSAFELAVMRKEDLESRSVYNLYACDECGEYFAPAKHIQQAKDVLMHVANNDEAIHAAETVGICPACKQRRDAISATKHASKGGVK